MGSEKKRVAATSVLAAVFLTGMKLAVGLLTGSLGILSEAAHSGLDLLAGLMTWFAVSVSGRPADEDHPYGHEKIENLSALFETMVLLVTCAWIIYEAVDRLFFKQVEIEVAWWTYAVVGLAIVIDFTRSRALYRVAEKYHSPALEADALHFSSDIYSSLVVLAGLVLTQFGYPQADAIAAIGVSLFVVWISYRLGKKAVDNLVDRVSVDHVQRATDAAQGVPGVRRAYGVRVREAGAKHFVDLKVALDRGASLERTHEVTEAVERAIQEVFRQADVVVHAEPDETGPRGLTEEVFGLAQEAGAGMHDLVVHDTGAGLQVDVHLEWPPDTSLSEAHRRSAGIERSLRDSFPRVRLIHTHLECVRERSRTDPDVTGAHPRIVERVCQAARGEPGVRGCSDVRILEGESGLWVTLTCVLAAGITLREAHEIATKVEKSVMMAAGGLHSVSVHAEPDGEGP